MVFWHTHRVTPAASRPVSWGGELFGGRDGGHGDAGTGGDELHLDLGSEGGEKVGCVLQHGLDLLRGGVVEVDHGTVHRGGLSQKGHGVAATAASRPLTEPQVPVWSRPRIRTATTPPEAAVRAATTATAAGRPKASATTPETTAPTANPPSRHSR